MAIYRGTGGSAEATNNATVNEVAGYATDAETSATNAASSATSAASSATSAASSATASASSATASESSATASASSASASATSASNASTSASQAASSASAASTSASNASTSETNAASSETAAASSASSAATSATSAATSLAAIGDSEASAATSATNAANSATAASASETNAATSATSAATSATNASTSASNASTSETNASASASAASTSETNAATSETNAAASATGAATSETNAATSASNASTSETNAATSASNASTSASNAATSETNAATSASEAAASAASIISDELESAANAAAAAQSYDNFDDRYLGAKASDPTVDNDGDALITGAMYFDSSNNVMKVYSGTEWQNASSSIEGIKSDFVFTATASQVLFSGSDDNTNTLVIDKAGLVNVYLNGVRLTDADYTIDAPGNSVTLGSGATVGDIVEIEVFGNFAGQSGADVAITGGSITGLTELSTGTFTSTGIDDNATSTAITIDASENVGIGTVSPQSHLEISKASPTIRLTNTDGSGNLQIAHTGSSYSYGGVGANQPIIYSVDDISIMADGSHNLKFHTNSAERARIDSSGNLLVGTTTANPTTGAGTGISLQGAGYVFASKSNDACIIGNRTSSDGNIAIFKKDGSTVGSIGNVDGNTIYIQGGNQFWGALLTAPQSSGQGVRLIDNGNSVRKFSSSGDGIHDLGGSTDRFKDLYLSGGVVFNDAGGSGSATSNTLDSYEEGSWSPSLANGATATNMIGTYTRVGNLVTAVLNLTNSTISGSPSHIVTGLPFTCAERTAISVTYYSAFNTACETLTGIVAGNTTQIEFLGVVQGSGWSTASLTAGSNRYVHMTVTYRTSA